MNLIKKGAKNCGEVSKYTGVRQNKNGILVWFIGGNTFRGLLDNNLNINRYETIGFHLAIFRDHGVKKE
jgi:hypothetical protein